MGIGPGYRCKSSGVTGPTALTEGNPNPKNYKVIKAEAVKSHLVVMIKYPDCKNYEGNKVLVYQNMTLSALISRTQIDPHFSDKVKSPVARFEPTDLGWLLAIKLARAM